MGTHNQDAAVWAQLPANEYSVKGRGLVTLKPGNGFMIWFVLWQIVRALVELRADPSLASRGQRGLSATLPCALGLAARYIKTGASVTESALWKLRGLADGHFWRSRSIIKMKSSDWAVNLMRGLKWNHVCLCFSIHSILSLSASVSQWTRTTRANNW